jgi:DNA invertase Pin-like site-specific DNA recombinase
MIHSYARVSTDGQSIDAQVNQLRAAGAEKISRETASGPKTVFDAVLFSPHWML